ncbi:hypothetical protein ACP70R_031404 [Stipagrostis hirtigluma subsp. patula]
MSSWCPAGSPNSMSSWRGDDRPAPTHGAGGESSQLFPVPDVTAAIASYLTSQTPQHPQPQTYTRQPAVGDDASPSQPKPGQPSTAALRPWASTPMFTTPPPPPRSISSWTAQPGVMAMAVPAETHDVSSGGGQAGVAAGYDAPGCLRMARRAGRAAADEGRNFVLSPLSLHAALALVAAGTNGETRRELLGFLGSVSLEELQGSPATKLLGTLRGLPETSFACGVWVDGRWALKPEFTDVAGTVYAAEAESVDFVSQAEPARQRVNAFVSDATRGLIGDVLPPGSVGSSTVIVLANALYFKGAWALPFDRSSTITAPFHLPDGATVRAPFMTSTFEQHVAVFPGFRALKLPYGCKNDGNHWHPAACFYMLLLLPDGEAMKIADLYDMAVSTPGFIGNHTPAGKVPVGRFMVPKFKFTFQFEASEDMKKLGVAGAFAGGDFSGMVAGGDGLRIAGVYHSATIEVDEQGTVAAAATAVCIYQCGIMAPPVDFVADRPLLFAVVEERTGAVLFLGHVVNPLAE